MKHLTANKIRISHILLSWDKAINSTHSREIGFALHDAHTILADLKKGTISWNQAVYEHSACMETDIHTGDLGWREQHEITPELWVAAITTPVGDLFPEPVNSPYGIHIVYRTG